MIELMKNEFDVKASECRVGRRVKKWADDFILVLLHKNEDIVRNLTMRIVEYAGELVETRGQESKFARSLYGELCAGLSMLRDCGLLMNGEFRVSDFQMMMRDLVFDELRRCGVRTYSGVMEHSPICIPPIPSCDE